MPKAEVLATAAIAPVIALEDVIRSLHARLTSSLRARWSDLTKDSSSKHDLIVHFLAVLELVRNGSASVTQERLFSDMSIELETLSGAPRYGV